MNSKTILLLLLFVFSTIDESTSRKSSSSHRTSHSRGSSTHRIGSYGTSTSRGSVSSHPATSGQVHSVGHKPIGFGISRGGSSASQSTGTSFGGHRDMNKHFLDAEGGGASRPVQPKPQPSLGHSYPSALPSSIGQTYAPNIGGKSSNLQPSAPTSHASNLPNPPSYTTTSQTKPAWSNPYLGTSHVSTSGQAHRAWSNPSLNVNQTFRPSQTQPSWSNSHLGLNRSVVSNQASSPQSNSHLATNPPIQSGAQPPPYGFNVYPQTHSSPSGFHTNQPHPSGHPTYPSASSGSHWQPPLSPTPIYQPNAIPFGNPYSLHPPANTYGPSGSTYYPQQSQHVLTQPAMQPFVPGQTVLIVPGQQDSGRGFGQMVKEALVFSTINAGVSRLLNPHTHYVESRPADSSPTTTTHITYNNQYFNNPPGMNTTTAGASIPQEIVSNGPYMSNVGPGSVPPLGNRNMYPTSSISNNGVSNPSGTVNKGEADIAGNVVLPTTQSNALSNQGNTINNPNVTESALFYSVSDDQLYKITEELFAKMPNISKYIKLNLQNRSTSSNATDEAREPLFDIEPELFNYPSISVTQSLYDSYEHDFRKKLNRTREIREHENLLIDTFLNTNVMATATQWLADRDFIDPDDFERKDVLRRIWFTLFSGSSCGFERVFASEKYDTAIIGVQDWLYFANQETLKRINYMGYVDKLHLGDIATLVKLNFEMDNLIRTNATIFVGTTPELEMSLYTICFYARPNNVCPVSLGGTKFNIYTHAFTYFGTSVIDLGLPIF
ncbi:uncharacterized protein LOC143187359 [Calliopsis andreniformis]|uniref:uncharacterized protein LOC143187359 n=1 Tax=Calliopsis andreniformis TaxID=337506 RepID=UPI003FCEB9AF